MATPSSSQSGRAQKRKNHDDDRVHNSAGEETFDFTEKTWMSDVAFVVDGKRLYASKSILGLRSPVFRAMFGDDFSERNATEVELPGKKYSDFLMFLKFLVPYKSKEINLKECMIILPLANEYQVADLLEKCESLLHDSLTTRVFSSEFLIRLLQLADICNLNSVVECIADKISFVDPKKLAQDLKLDFVSSDLRQKLMERYFDRYQECQTELVQHSFDLDVPVDTADFENSKGVKVKITVDISECTVLLDKGRKILNTSSYVLWNLEVVVSCCLIASQPKKKTLPQLAFFIDFLKTGEGSWQCETKLKLSLRCNTPSPVSSFETKVRGKYKFCKGKHKIQLFVIDFTDLLKPPYKYVIDDKIEAELRILAKEPESVENVQ